HRTVEYGRGSAAALLCPTGPLGFVPPKVDRRSVLEADEVSLPPSVTHDFRHSERLSHGLPACVTCRWRQAILTHAHPPPLPPARPPPWSYGSSARQNPAPRENALPPLPPCHCVGRGRPA